jgi:hypothetical protein
VGAVLEARRAPEQKTLHGVASCVAQLSELGLGLYTLCNNREAQSMGKLDRRKDDRCIP